MLRPIIATIPEFPFCQGDTPIAFLPQVTQTLTAVRDRFPARNSTTEAMDLMSRPNNVLRGTPFSMTLLWDTPQMCYSVWHIFNLDLPVQSSLRSARQRVWSQFIQADRATHPEVPTILSYPIKMFCGWHSSKARLRLPGDSVPSVDVIITCCGEIDRRLDGHDLCPRLPTGPCPCACGR
jgi:hypothetical protein